MPNPIPTANLDANTGGEDEKDNAEEIPKPNISGLNELLKKLDTNSNQTPPVAPPVNPPPVVTPPTITINPVSNISPVSIKANQTLTLTLSGFTPNGDSSGYFSGPNGSSSSAYQKIDASGNAVMTRTEYVVGKYSYYFKDDTTGKITNTVVYEVLGDVIAIPPTQPQPPINPNPAPPIIQVPANINPVSSVSPTNLRVGQTINFNNTGFTPTSDIKVFFLSPSGNGNWSSSILKTDVNGNLSNSANADVVTGKYGYYAQDISTGKESAKVYYDVIDVNPRVTILPNIANSSTNIVFNVNDCASSGWTTIYIKYPNETGDYTKALYYQADLNGFLSIQLAKEHQQAKGEYFVMVHYNKTGKNSWYSTYSIN